MKSTIESRRSKNEMGHLLWQFNEIWPTGGWGSIEYSAPKGLNAHRGQIIGGRWKPLHYLFRANLLTDVMAICSGDSGICYIRNDGSEPLQCTVVISSISIETGARGLFLKKPVDMKPGPGTVLTFSLSDLPCYDGAECGVPVDGRTHYLSLDVIKEGSADDKVELISHNDMLLVPPKDITTLPPSSGLEVTVGSCIQSDGAEGSDAVEIIVTVQVPVALYVVLTTEAPGRFSDNAFFMRPPVWAKELLFYPFDDSTCKDLDLLKSTIRVEDMAMYQKPPPESPATKIE
jgi:hypothetical protein